MAISESAWLRQLARPDATMEVYANGFRTVSEAAKTRVAGTPFQILDRVLPRHVLYFILRNTVRIVVDGVEDVLRPSSFMWLAPGLTHSFAFDPVRHVTLIHIVLRIESGGRELLPPHRTLIEHHADAIAAPMRMLHERLREPSPYAAESQRAALTLVTAAAFDARRRAAAGRRLDHAQCRRLEDLIASGRSPAPHPRDLARALGLSHDYFTRLFHATYGTSPRLWLNRERLQRAAADLLQSSRPIGDLAVAHGYPDIYSFSKQFKKVMGESPARYRRSRRG
jgi:AraC-like DNA-binding protein